MPGSLRAARQLWLANDDEWPKDSRYQAEPGNKLIVMLKPPLWLAQLQFEAACDYCKRYPGNYRPYPADLLHVSVACLAEFPGMPPEPFLQMTKAALGRIQARPIAFRWERSALFGNSNDLVLVETHRNNEPFQQFAQDVSSALRTGNVPHLPNKKVTAHSTLVYKCKGLPEMPVANPYIWTAEEFLLVLSVRKPRIGKALTAGVETDGEHHHKVLGRWRFDPSAPPHPDPPRQLDLAVTASGPGRKDRRPR